MKSVTGDGTKGCSVRRYAGSRCSLVAMIFGLVAGYGLGFANRAYAEPITVGTYNVQVAVLDDAIDDWIDTRRHQVFESIVANQPDFMGFQEAYARMSNDRGITQQTALGQLFKDTQWQYYSWEADNEFNMNPIIVDTDRFNTVATGSLTINFEEFLGLEGWEDYFELHEFFHGNGEGFVHFLGPERYANWVVADDLVDGGRVAFLTSHYETFIGQNGEGPEYDELFEYFSELVNSSFGYASEQVHAQAELLKKDWGVQQAIIGGDFETSDPKLPSQQVYMDAGYTETWRFINGDGPRPTQGIDNMFVMLDGFTIEDSYYDEADYTDGASDHKPLYADVTLVIVGAPCEGDANGDELVDPLDSGFVLARFGCTVGTGDANCDAADQNGDGVVDPLDSGFVLARFGECS